MGSLGHTDFDDVGTKVLSPSTLAHVVLRTGNFQKMVDFYLNFLGGTVTYGNDFISFITYDEEHHRIALIGIPGTGPKVPTSAGMEHIAFTFPTLSALLLAYRQRKARGIPPAWCVNHGPTTSIYYKDPDGNMLETQVDNFDTIESANEFMTGKYFAENPIGTDFDAEELIQKIKDGVPDADLKKRVEIGPRGLPSDF
ncbi:Glyoxalase/Bleomycin resistance protein/Dihydroxybiphenyl dioxygenase [Exophiala viscosa]|uniref:Glyoxalase/Bleomycin resistance protein/Dihydroxybiphenyl dioxygenase n=1 Tax=Exophiala viscosa TaxID=2486360 RepID=A0AAN6E1P9_9EURO|nr:Glyoxalase/Bleomycin resistance protein/Dihydroxybiphenyl dioxygenase [Exophiala viscosa]KAI1629840.1 Glyoxalase/Bleomycin resistance protein/Dihydroxybiphenyl dioxygenase [Exophiala viscosa]